MDSITEKLIFNGMYALDLYASIFAKEWLKRNVIYTDEGYHSANVEQCAKLSYEFAKGMVAERIKILNDLVKNKEK